MTSMIAALRTQLSAKELANAIDTPSAELVRRWGRGEAQPSAKYQEKITTPSAQTKLNIGSQKQQIS